MRKLSNEARKELEAVAAMPDSEIRDWRGKTLAKAREIIHEADPEIIEGRERLSGTVSFAREGKGVRYLHCCRRDRCDSRPKASA